MEAQALLHKPAAWFALTRSSIERASWSNASSMRSNNVGGPRRARTSSRLASMRIRLRYW